MHARCSLKFYNKIHEGPLRRKEAKGVKRSRRAQRQWGRRAKWRERERQREREEKQNERDGDEDGERRRGRGTRETKGMWSSPSLCLAALWLKRRIPREGGGSRPAQSVLSLPWSPACRPQKRTAKNLQDGLLLLHRVPPTIGSKESAKQAQIVTAHQPPPQF